MTYCYTHAHRGTSDTSTRKMFSEQQTSSFLHTGSQTTAQPLQNRVNELQACQPPQTIRHLRRFLGMLHLYRRFLPMSPYNLCTTFAPTHVPIVRNPPTGHQNSTGPSKMQRQSVARQNDRSPGRHHSITLATEASNTAMGVVLQQTKHTWQTLNFFSKKMSTAQQKYRA